MNRHQYFLNFDDGVKQTNLTVADVLEFEAKYPAPPEQKKIGLLFKAIDNAITLHQREQSDRRTLICKKIIKKSFFIAILRDG